MSSKWVMTNEEESIPKRKRIFNKQQGKCAICNKELILHRPDNISYDDRVMHIDHILPKSMGGKNDINNLRGLCAKCNTSRNNRVGKEAAKVVINGLNRINIDLFNARIKDSLNVGLLTNDELKEIKKEIFIKLSDIKIKILEI